MSASAAYVTRIAAFLPNEPVTNDQMESVLGQVGPRASRTRRVVLRSNGIRSRHYVIDPVTRRPTHSNARLAAESIRRLQDDDFSLEDVDCLAASTAVADQLLPSHASMVHGELGSPPCEVLSTAGVCVAGISALKYAWLGVRAGAYRHAVASASEVSSALLRAEAFRPGAPRSPEELERRPELAFDKDFLRWMLSDGAGAMLLEPEPRDGRRSLRVDWIELFSYANEIEACMFAGAEKMHDGSLRGWAWRTPEERVARSIMAIQQDVRLLNSRIIHYTVERALTDLVQRRPLFPDQIDHFVPHYSSEFFRNPLYEGMKKAGFEIPQDRWFSNLTTCGNTGSAAIYIALEELHRSGNLQPGERILCYIPESGRFSVAYMLLTVV